MREKLTPTEKAEIKSAKKSYAKSMYEFLGSSWRTIAKKLKVMNVPSDPIVRKQYQSAAEAA